jgi:hypothetical protein
MAVVNIPGKVEFEDRPVPALSTGKVLIKFAVDTQDYQLKMAQDLGALDVFNNTESELRSEL